MALDPEDTLVTVDLPVGMSEVTLAFWLATGPRYPSAWLVAARSKATGADIPLADIPAEYHRFRAGRD